jgi:hypothetical protein
MPPVLSKDTFDASKGYEKVIAQVNGALLDFDVNESQDIIRDNRDRLVNQLADGTKLLGSAGQVKPAVSGLARMVDVVAGIAVSGGKMVRLPSATDLQVFSNGTTSGTVSSVVYAAWWDTQVDWNGDANIRPVDPTNFGDGNWRLKRNVQIRVVQGSTVLPAPGAGETFIQLAIVTHDFTPNAIVQPGDVVQDPYGLTPGELAGYGAARTLRLTSNALNSDTGFTFDTRVARSSGALAKLRDAGVVKIWIDKDGKVSLGTGAAPTEALDVSGNLKASGDVMPGNNIVMAASKTVDGVDVGSHTHTGVAGMGPQLSHGAALTGLGNDDHTQYVHNTVARTISAVHTFNPGSAAAPFVLGANATGQKVIGLNADLLDGLDSAYLLDAGNATGTLADARLTSNVALKNAANVFTVEQSVSRATASDPTWRSRVAADTQDRFLAMAGGTLEWGPGNAARDTNLYRSAADVLKTDDDFDALAIRVGGTTVVTAARVLQNVTLDASLLNAGTLGDGRLSANVPLKNAANVFTAAQSLSRATAADVAFDARVTGDTNARLTTLVTGKMSWGAGGASAADSHLEREGVAAMLLTGTLRTTARVKSDGNLLDGATASLGISASGSVQVDSVGKRALVTYIKIDPGAYSGAYDVFVYQDNNTTSLLLAKWQGQSGIMEDRVPWYFKNVRSDERLYVQITKATTGVVHSFAVTLDAERFA